jgi:hypothetical protein
LERRWERTLRTLREAEARIAETRAARDKVVPLALSRDLRAAFASLGQSLPEVWQQGTLRRAQRKALLRCLIDKVVIHREGRDAVRTRIVWRGGAVTDMDIPVTVGALRDLTTYPTMERRLLDLEARGDADEQIARALTAEGFRSPLRDRVLPSTVQAIRLRHRRIRRYTGPRPRAVSGALTLPQIARAVEVKPHWLYHLIRRGVLEVERDPATKMYLFPDRADTVEALRQLRDGKLTRVSVGREDRDA